MSRPVQCQMHVDLGASQARRRLKGFGHGVRRVVTDGKGRAVIFHTSTGQHLQELEALFVDVLRMEFDSAVDNDVEDRSRISE